MALTLCVLLWAHDERDDDLVRYEDQVLPLLADHGGRVVQRVRASGRGGEPSEVHILELPDEAALDAYMADPRRVALSEDRDAAIAKTEVIRVTPVD
jgi:uncharacterized protein (DUF1330 family)